MISTLSKGSQAGTFAFTAERIFDAWGPIRSTNATGDPKGRYCVGIGHKQDDESGLIYMRARYYDPGVGRFISEDPNREGKNMYAYACSCPTSRCDRSGREDGDLDEELTEIGVDETFDAFLSGQSVAPQEISEIHAHAFEELGDETTLIENAIRTGHVDQIGDADYDKIIDTILSKWNPAKATAEGVGRWAQTIRAYNVELTLIVGLLDDDTGILITISS